MALIRPLAWEHPYGVGAALEKQKAKKEKTLKNKIALVPIEPLGYGFYLERDVNV